MKKNLSKLVMLPALLLIAGCPAKEEKDDDDDPELAWVQIERLGRPGINEALVVTNDYLNAFNSIPPTADLSDAAAAVRTEVVTILEAIDGLDGNQNVDSNVIAGAFLPDVMRIDTTLDIAVDETAYAAAANALGSVVGGRKIEDDVIDITYSVLIGAAVPDGVSYEGVPGNQGQPGHKSLNGATAGQYLVPATFPFLATPN